MNDWLEQVSEDSLLNELPSSLAETIRAMDSTGINLDTIGQILSNNPSAGLVAKGGTGWPSNLWQLTKEEISKILCTDDPKYTSLRSDLNKQTNVTSEVILAIISSAVTSKLGLEIGLLTPFVILVLMTVLRAGKEAWCVQHANAPLQVGKP